MNSDTKQCYSCGEGGHIARNCGTGGGAPRVFRGGAGARGGGFGRGGRGGYGSRACFRCGRNGHIAAGCQSQGKKKTNKLYLSMGVQIVSYINVAYEKISFGFDNEVELF